jgi:hypothetical protein
MAGQLIKPFERRGGRKAGTPNKSTAAIKELAQQYGEAAMAELARLAMEAESEMVQIAACREILDRAYGKATQPVRGGDDVEDGPLYIITGVPDVEPEEIDD